MHAKYIVTLMDITRSSVKRTHRLISFLSALALCTGEAQALGLGELSVRSRLGELFKAEVQLIESAGETRSTGDCFRLSNAGEGDSGIPILTRGRISLERQNGKSKLLIASDQIINDPALQINLRANCGAEVVRSYTVLIDPIPPQQLAHQSGRSLLANKSITPEISPQPLAAEKSYPNVWQTAQGETGQSITKALFPRQSRAQRRFLAALQAENPQFDLGVKGEALLDVETVLSIPDTRRPAPSTPAFVVGENHAAKEVPPGVVSGPARRVKAALQKSARRMGDRLVISGDAQEGSPKSDAPLRLSTDLSTRLSSKVSENSRASLRLEYQLLSALYDQAERQLATAEKVRNLEASFEKMRAASENTVRQIEAAMAPATSAKLTVSGESSVAGSPPSAFVTASLTSTPGAALFKSSTPRQEKRSSWWLEILIVLGLIGVLTWVFFRKSVMLAPVLFPIVADKPLYIPQPFSTLFDKLKPLDAEYEYEALLETKTSGTAPHIVRDAPTPSAVVIKDIGRNQEYSAVVELAELMVMYSHVKDAIEVLEEFLAREPSTSVGPWLKLLKIYQMNDMRKEFEASSTKFRTHFNVAPVSWETAGECLKEPITPCDDNDVSIEELLKKLPTVAMLPHIKDKIQNSWDSPDGLIYLKHLLCDTRDGTRSGFQLTTARELQFLVELLEIRSLKAGELSGTLIGFGSPEALAEVTD